ncbi:hypothetical protein Vadar_004349 [Vaccinium darrowii]|uniref:Uncharacterized protein n=1 Tax=Vaccinium darrowii TaxID=229202 RepID=A0ACB7XX29_9ERIC|nr:hypothetical protein Vadar_004349 [Vaccinium darrowii]
MQIAENSVISRLVQSLLSGSPFDSFSKCEQSENTRDISHNSFSGSLPGIALISVNARPGPINTPTGCHPAKVHWSPYDEIVLALKGIKNSGPSPGEGHSFVDGVKN